MKIEKLAAGKISAQSAALKQEKPIAVRFARQREGSRGSVEQAAAGSTRKGPRKGHCLGMMPGGMMREG
jgi:hypothetical protein